MTVRVAWRATVFTVRSTADWRGREDVRRAAGREDEDREDDFLQSNSSPPTEESPHNHRPRACTLRWSLKPQRLEERGNARPPELQIPRSRF